MENTLTVSEMMGIGKKIYDKLNDLQSKKLFLMRISNNFPPKRYCGLLESSSTQIKEIARIFMTALEEMDKNEPLIIWGAGFCNDICMEVLDEYGLTGSRKICDTRYDTIQEIGGYKVYSPEFICSTYAGEKIIIASFFTDLVVSILKDQGIPKENILIPMNLDVSTQYFDEMIEFQEDEVFVDCGGYDGYTSLHFAELSKGKYKKIYIAEPDEKNVNIMLNNSNFPSLNAEIIPVAVWHQKEILRFSSGQLDCSKVDSAGDLCLNADSLDNFFSDKSVEDVPTFIKMDIEGSELNALKGAEEIILKRKPKLAISVYHKPEDIIEIANYLMCLVPEYRFYLRHYSTYLDETVLYAIL